MENNAVTSLFLFFVTTTLLIVAAYYATRFIGQKAAVFSKTKHVGLLEKSILSGNLSIEVLKVGDRVYVLASKGKEVTLLDQYSMDEWLEMRSSDTTFQDEASYQKNPKLYKSGVDYFKQMFAINRYEKKD